MKKIRKRERDIFKSHKKGENKNIKEIKVVFKQIIFFF